MQVYSSLLALVVNLAVVGAATVVLDRMRVPGGLDGSAGLSAREQLWGRREVGALGCSCGRNPPAARSDVRDVEREAAVARLFASEAVQLQRLAALLGAGHEAEDVVSEAFCDLHRWWGRLSDPETARAYLRSVVCNLVRMRLRHLAVVR